MYINIDHISWSFQLGTYLLYSVASSAAEQLKPHLADIAAIIAAVLAGDQSNLAPFYAIKTLTEVVFYVGDDALKPVQNIVPQILAVIKNLITLDQVLCRSVRALLFIIEQCLMTKFSDLKHSINERKAFLIKFYRTLTFLWPALIIL